MWVSTLFAVRPSPERLRIVATHEILASVDVPGPSDANGMTAETRDRV
jgi:hypothetical protein